MVIDFKVRLTEEVKALLRETKTFGAFDREILDIANNALDEGSDYLLASLKSFVPVDTFELRGKNLADGMIRKRRLNQYAYSVYISDDLHKGRNNNPLAASVLAKILDSGEDQGRPLHRTQNAASIQSISFIGQRVGGIITTPKEGETTAGWIDKAFDDAELKFDRHLAEINR